VKHTIGLSALVAGALLWAGSLGAQSDNSGLMLNLHLVGNGVSLVAEDAEAESGGGFGLAVGYGFNERAALYLNLDIAAIEYDEDEADNPEDTYGAVTADLGVRMNFGNESLKLRPYVNAAFSGFAVVETVVAGGEEYDAVLSGGGLTVGGGVQYFFTPSLAVDLGLQATQGAFTDVAVDDEEEELPQGIAFTTSRLQLGVTWHP
jgi:opacity protein-like surface antigen